MHPKTSRRNGVPEALCYMLYPITSIFRAYFQSTHQSCRHQRENGEFHVSIINHAPRRLIIIWDAMEIHQLALNHKLNINLN